MARQGFTHEQSSVLRGQLAAEGLTHGGSAKAAVMRLGIRRFTEEGPPAPRVVTHFRFCEAVVQSVELSIPGDNAPLPSEFAVLGTLPADVENLVSLGAREVFFDVTGLTVVANGALSLNVTNARFVPHQRVPVFAYGGPLDPIPA